MINWLNIYSFIFLGLVIIGLALVTTPVISRVWLRALILGFVATSLLACYLFLRTGTSTTTVQGDMGHLLAGRTPALVEFYSDY